MAAPKSGDVYVYTGTDQIGNGNGGTPIHPGQKFTVRELVDANTNGAFDDSEDCVVLEFDDPEWSVGLTADGEPAVIHARRAWSVGVAQFNAEFEKEA